MVDGSFIYLIGENRLGWRAGGGTGSPFMSLTYETEYGLWDIRIFDDISTHAPFDNQFGSGARERAGRYSFGFAGYGTRSRDLVYDPVIKNRFGITADRPLNPNWNVRLRADRSDFFSFDDDRHSFTEHVGAKLYSAGDWVPLSPWVRYDAYSSDNWDTVQHTAYVGGSQRIGEDVFVDGRVGYLWETGDRNGRESVLWSMGVRHRVSPRTTHGVLFGQDYFVSDFSDDSVVSNYFQYYISHRITDRLAVRGFAQWSEDEFLSGRFVGGTYETEVRGFRFNYKVSETVSADFGYRYEQRRNTKTGNEREIRVYDANLNAQLDLRTNGYLRYQFEDADIYDEDLYVAGIRRSF
jgi:hypothetical protein